MSSIIKEDKLMKIDRIISMILILIEKKKVSAKELSAMFEVSIRTVYRDITQ